MDLSGWSRKKACLFNGILMLLLSMPCVLGFNVLSKFQPLGPGTGVLDLEDFVVSNLLLPLGSLIFIFFCTSRYGWGWKDFTKEANTGKGLKVQRLDAWLYVLCAAGTGGRNPGAGADPPLIKRQSRQIVA